VYYRVRDGSGRKYARPPAFRESSMSTRNNSIVQDFDGAALLSVEQGGSSGDGFESRSHFLPHSGSFVSNLNDPSLVEIMSFLEAIDPRKRPTHKTGFLGIFGTLVDSADYYAKHFREWDAQVHRLRRFPEQSPSTAVAIVTFDSPQSAVSRSTGSYI
jgi:hypothetical protein